MTISYRGPHPAGLRAEARHEEGSERFALTGSAGIDLVRWATRLTFTTDQVHTVLTRGSDTEVELLLVRVGGGVLPRRGHSAPEHTPEAHPFPVSTGAEERKELLFGAALRF